jgi:calcium-dependent protein kinase
MGNVVESCKQHIHCCNNDDKIVETETDEYSESLSSSGEHENDNDDATDDNNKIEGSQKDLIDMRVKVNDLVMERQISPWKYYKHLLTLGSGTYGTVKKVSLINNPSTVRAMKIISKENIMEGVDNSKLIDEVAILKKLDHPNIMKIYECYVDQDNFYIISDFCDQGDLLGKLEKLGKMNEIVVKFLMEQILNAVAYLHSKNVLHGDIKLENILLYTASKTLGRRFTSINMDINHLIDLRREINRNNSVTKRSRNYVNDMLNYEIKLIDFGCSKYFVNKKKHQKLSGIIGTTLYCSPEVVDDLYDEKSDEWSCGVLMYILLCGEPPFQGNNEEEIFQKIKKCQYNFKPKEFNEVSNNCKDLIKKLLEPKKKKRIKASEALKHPFFSESFNPSRAMTENKDLSILEKLIKYKKKPSKFHETMYAFICNNYIGIDEEKKLRAVFRYIDKEDKNALSKSALKKCLHEINIDLQDEEFNKIFKLLDANRSEYIEYQEFLRATCDKNALLTEENLKNAFLALGGGDEKECINGEDIKKFIFHDIIIKDNKFNEYLNQFGMKNDDTINFEQFCDMMKNDKKLNGESIELDESEEEIIRKNNSFNKKSNSNQNEIASEIRKINTLNLKKMSIIDEKAEFGIENNKNNV